MARRNFFLFKNVYLLSRGKKAAGPLADLEGGKAAKLIAGWILPRMMRLAFSRAGHDTTLPRQRDHVIRPQCCWLLRCCVVVNAKLKIFACGALVFSITNKKQHSFCSNSMVHFFFFFFLPLSSEFSNSRLAPPPPPFPQGVWSLHFINGFPDQQISDNCERGRVSTCYIGLSGKQSTTC